MIADHPSGLSGGLTGVPNSMLATLVIRVALVAGT